MSEYQHFLKVLEEDFGEFVLSRGVNLYLQTIGPAIKGEELQDGVLYEFTIVSGYETERGHWATALHNNLRFGDEIITIDGLPDPIVLTPNFFYGRNLKGEELEYRLGLIKTAQRAEICPVILRKTENGIVAKLLLDLCVIYTGVFIDAETAEQLGQQKAVELTTYQEFLTSFWNIDDYIRKQNPNFHSDYDIELWHAIEVFSGRIIDQMLSQILDLGQDDPDWVIPGAHSFHCQKIITSIERALDERNQISENQLLIYIKNLCSYICRFNDKPLEILAKKGFNLIPYLLEGILNPPEEEMRTEAHKVLKKIIIQYPHFVQSEIKTIIQVSTIRWNKECYIFHGIIGFIIEKQPSLTQLLLTTSLNLLSSPNKHLRAGAVFTYKCILRYHPQYLNQDLLNSFQILLDDPYKRVQITILRIFKEAIKQNPEFITQFFIDRICGLLLDQSKNVKIAALETFEVALQHLPEYITTNALNHVIQMLNNSNVQLRKFILQTFQILLKKKPHLFNLSGMDTIHRFMIQRNPKKLKILLKAQKIVIEKKPQLIRPTDIDKLLLMLSNPNNVIKLLALKNLGYILVRYPELFTVQDVNRITKMFLEPDGSVRLSALWFYRGIIVKAPHLIDQRVIPILTKLFTDSNRKIKKCARRLYGLLSKVDSSPIENQILEIPT